MKPHVNSTKDIFREKKGNVGYNRQKKVWKMSYKTIDESCRTWRKEKLNEWYDDEYYNYISIDHAIEQLNKRLRSYSFFLKNMLKGKEIKLINKETRETVPLGIVENEIVILKSKS